MIEWRCPKCGNTTTQRPVHRNEKCRSCGEARLRLFKACAHCGIEWHPDRESRAYCSVECKAAAQRGEPISWLNAPDVREKSAATRREEKARCQCVVCGEVFEVFPYRSESARYCSKECWAKRGPEVVCGECGRVFKRRSGGQVYCCADCRRAARAKMVGPAAPAWKGGASLLNERGRYSGEIAAWRNAVYGRDGYTCQGCGATGVTLHAHHVVPWAEDASLRFDVANGIALCEDCHGRIHGIDFSKCKSRECKVCGAAIVNKCGKGLCRSCASRLRHWATRIERGQVPTLEADGTEFEV